MHHKQTWWPNTSQAAYSRITDNAGSPHKLTLETYNPRKRSLPLSHNWNKRTFFLKTFPWAHSSSILYHHQQPLPTNPWKVLLWRHAGSYHNQHSLAGFYQILQCKPTPALWVSRVNQAHKKRLWGGESRRSCSWRPVIGCFRQSRRHSIIVNSAGRI